MFFRRKLKVSKKMKPIQKSDIQTTPRLGDKLKFLEMTTHDIDSIKKLENVIDQLAVEITNRHYRMLSEYGNLEKIMQDHSTVDRLSQTFIQYVKSIPRIKLDTEYIQNRVKIGEVHSRIRLTPEWYTGSYIRVYEYVLPEIIEQYGHRPDEMKDILMALIRIVTLDSQIVLESYQEANDFKIIESVSSVMETVIGLDKISTLMNTVASAAENVESVSAAAEQLSASVEEVATNAVSVAENTEETIQQVEQGREVIEKSLTGFLGMTDSFIETRNKINTLLDEIKNVSQVVEFIKGVAEQTNLLALNASIEAARAGEQGRGFSVVADEVRNLAEQTKESVDKITKTIQQVQTEAREVSIMEERMANQLNDQVDQAKDAIETLGTIVSRIELIGSSTGNIAAIAQEQSAATHDITLRISEVLHQTDEIKNDAQYTGQTIYDVSMGINNLRKKAIGSIPRLQNKQVIRVVKTEHLLWKWWVYNSILGYHQMEAQHFVNHTQCRLGKWYEQMRKHPHISKLPAFKELEAPHRHVHELAQEAHEYINRGQKDKAESLLYLIEESSVEVVRLLDQIQNEMDRRA
ncbi:methyl-accepting chemotaxis protein [Aneurinibacillus sp. REN35]|uniref:methyl-accepting chemotaxis protein n=1 Tax=Aneurinibacillus sp. REN35 TaxID=3237286 RepID=UPI003529B93B